MATKFLSKEGLERVLQNLAGKFNSYVPVTRKINGKPLTSDITLNEFDFDFVTTPQMDAAIQAAIIDSWSSEI